MEATRFRLDMAVVETLPTRETRRNSVVYHPAAQAAFKARISGGRCGNLAHGSKPSVAADSTISPVAFRSEVFRVSESASIDMLRVAGMLLCLL